MKKVKSLADLGKLAGVSAATVSRALHDSPEIGQKTKDKIRKLAEKYNYTINNSARNLRLQKTNVIAVVLNPSDRVTSEFSNQPYVSNLLVKLCDELAHRGLDMMVSSERALSQCWDQHFLRSQRADGLIVLGQGPDTSMFKRLSKLDTPFVVDGTYTNQKEYCVVGCDSRISGAMAASHLIESAGRKNILYIGPTDNFEAKQRIDGYQNAVNKHGLPTSQDMVVECEFDVNSAYQCIERILQEGKLVFDGIFACNDEIAIGAMQCLQANGISVPNQVSVIGYDNSPSANHCFPLLTSVSQQQEKKSTLLVDSLEQLIAGKKVKSVEIAARVIVRSSTIPNSLK